MVGFIIMKRKIGPSHRLVKQQILLELTWLIKGLGEIG